MIYLTSPYNDQDPNVREARFRHICLVASQLMSSGIHLFCPIAHTHPIALAGDLPHEWEYWQEYDRQMLSSCSELRIVRMEGWDESKGIAGEISIAHELGIPVVFACPHCGLASCYCCPECGQFIAEHVDDCRLKVDCLIYRDP